MPGPAPKSSAARQRRNRGATEAALLTTEQARIRAPSLGDHPDGVDWDRRTERWWSEVWDSPMSERFLRADEDGLHMLAVLVDRFWTDPSTKLAAEIRRQRKAYGLTPIDRRRLQWEVKRVEEREKPRAPETTATGDPRGVLKAV